MCRLFLWLWHLLSYCDDTGSCLEEIEYKTMRCFQLTLSAASYPADSWFKVMLLKILIFTLCFSMCSHCKGPGHIKPVDRTDYHCTAKRRGERCWCVCPCLSLLSSSFLSSLFSQSSLVLSRWPSWDLSLSPGSWGSIPDVLDVDLCLPADSASPLASLSLSIVFMSSLSQSDFECLSLSPVCVNSVRKFFPPVSLCRQSSSRS